VPQPVPDVARPYVVAVLVTWNRRDLLAEALSGVQAQTRLPEEVLVVDNASTDGTAELLADRFPDVTVVRPKRNLGGAGGFALGIARALDRAGADLLWLMDDDTVPTPTALERLVAARTGYPGESPALVASRVLWTDGREHPLNTPRVRPGASTADRTKAAAVGSVPIRSASFVSVLVDAAVARERGLPIADYFLWNDDFEYTTRLIRGHVGLACQGSTVVHKTTTFGSSDADPGARFFYEVRNKVWMFTRSSSLGPLEKIAYGGRTALRWGRTIARSRHRGTVLAGLGNGLVRGLLSSPRPTGALLESATEAVDGG
jgi:rhamnopyranosyl-N-acetylglucosaminyl-diphospho-decaprenol beta-1,3/1,4-galactofuranosyltransferase